MVIVQVMLVLAVYALGPGEPAVVRPVVETAVAPSDEDAADDPAIWIHPDDPAQSLIIGTDKQWGLLVFNLSGAIVQSLPDGRMNNVDVAYGFDLGGRAVDLACASSRSDNTIAVYRINEISRRLTPLGPRIETGLEEIYGLCMYRSARTGRTFVFVSDKSGVVQQWLLEASGESVGGRLTRQFDVGETVEGMVADPEHAALYVGEEEAAIWRYGAEPEAGEERTLVDRTGAEGHLVADVEGLAIYDSGDGAGYLIASSQGDDTFAVYERRAPHPYVLSFAVGANAEAGIDPVTHTDGIEVTSRPLGDPFPRGLFVAQDDENPGSRQNFKLVPWSAIQEAIEARRPEP